MTDAGLSNGALAPQHSTVPLLEAIKLALAQIRVQKLKSFFTLIGVAIGVMFLIAIVSIINGVGRYMEDDLVGKLITKNSFEVRSRPNIQMGDVDESEWRSYRSRPPITVRSVTGLSPARASIGSEVVISGSGFTGTRTVSFNGVEATDFNVDSNTRITAIVPAGASDGPVTVVNGRSVTSE